MKSCSYPVVVAVWLLACGSGAVTAQTIVKVDCAKNKSINEALKQNLTSQSLIIEIKGMCSENVVVTRDRVTLRGIDPALDGIQAELSATQMDAALWIRGAHQVVVENLKLTGGFTGLLATEASTISLKMVNCRSEGNSAFGVVLEGSLLEAEDTVLTSNGNFNAGVFLASRFLCDRCTLSDPLGTGAQGNARNNIVGGAGSTILLFDSALTNGGIQLTNALLQVSDSTIDAHAPDASLSGSQSIVSLTRVLVGGPMRFNQSSSAALLGVTQFRSESQNVVGENSFVRIADASPATGGPATIPSAIMGFSLQNFSSASLFQTSQINGNVNCGSGANAFCANPANVSGTSNCALCPKP